LLRCKKSRLSVFLQRDKELSYGVAFVV